MIKLSPSVQWKFAYYVILLKSNLVALLLSSVFWKWISHFYFSTRAHKYSPLTHFERQKRNRIGCPLLWCFVSFNQNYHTSTITLSLSFQYCLWYSKPINIIRVVIFIFPTIEFFSVWALKCVYIIKLMSAKMYPYLYIKPFTLHQAGTSFT